MVAPWRNTLDKSKAQDRPGLYDNYSQSYEWALQLVRTASQGRRHAVCKRSGGKNVTLAHLKFYIFFFCVGLDLRFVDTQAYTENYLPAQTWIQSVILRDIIYIVLKCSACWLRYSCTPVGGYCMNTLHVRTQVSCVQWKHTVTFRPTSLYPP